MVVELHLMTNIDLDWVAIELEHSNIMQEEQLLQDSNWKETDDSWRKDSSEKCPAQQQKFASHLEYLVMYDQLFDHYENTTLHWIATHHLTFVD